MKQSICHYSFHRTWEAEKWDCNKLAEEVKKLGVPAVDFHVRYLGEPADAAARVKQALDKSGLVLSGISMSNEFNQEDATKFKQQVESVKTWLKVAREVDSPVSRIFGGWIKDRNDKAALEASFGRIIDALGEVTREAEKLGVVLALENHGGLPCTGAEQVEVIKKIGSDNLKATIDVGNYMQANEEAHEGTAAAAQYAAYVHFKDFKKVPGTDPWELEACTVGAGDVDHRKCLEAMKQVGYDGFVALEYEGSEDERKAVPESVAFMKDIMEDF